MFDSIGAFNRQFTSVEGGYLYYPSRKGGGKLVTAQEFEALASNWKRIAGRSGRRKTVGVAFLVILIWTVLFEAFGLPDWAESIIIVGLVLAISGWLMWASFAPRRLVKDRPEVAPPRQVAQIRREARASLNWRFVIFALLMSGTILFGTLSSPDHPMSWWGWVIGSGAMFFVYLWIGFQKLRDR
ncbi:MAG: hypothetical protein ABR588_07005 [Sphingomicrobium sp.]|nr:hypothetical protein [Sphingomonadales bacterium]